MIFSKTEKKEHFFSIFFLWTNSGPESGPRAQAGPKIIGNFNVGPDWAQKKFWDQGPDICQNCIIWAQFRPNLVSGKIVEYFLKLEPRHHRY